MNETEKFLKDTEIPQEKTDILNVPLTPETPEKSLEKEEDEGLKAKNRRERRLLKQNQQLREETIATNARLQGLAEAQKLREGTETKEYLKRIEKIYGNATPETAEATALLKEALQGVKEEAKREAVEEWETKQSKAAEAVAAEERNIDNILEELEDEHNVDLTSDDSPVRKGFLALLERLSPKDAEGNIIEYADPSAVYELYESRKEKANMRAKELASRSMTRGGTGESKLEDDANVRFLKENDII